MTATPVQTTLEERVLEWTNTLCKALNNDYKRRYPDSHSDKFFEYTIGRKYIKVMGYTRQGDVTRSEGVHAFVDRKTGEVYKPASWRSPAKHVRYDLRIIKEREYVLNPDNCGWAGGYLYMR